jgi:excisionase family DNA binding protein
VSIFPLDNAKSYPEAFAFVLQKRTITKRRNRGMGLAGRVRVQERMSMKKTDTAIRLLTLAEAASILKISKRTLHRMIQQKQIPAFKVGGQWRILESRFQEWVQEEESSPSKLS